MSDKREMERRELLAHMLHLVGAASAVTLSGPALAKAAARAKHYLDAPVFTLLSAVADTIIPRTDTPGAIEARVPAKFDGLLATWASGQRRYELTQALARIDAAARDQKGKPFAELASGERHSLLAAHDIAALKAVPRKSQATGFASLSEEAAVVDPGYSKLKELIVVLYYYSEQALTSELAYEHSPGGWSPSIKVTPETRPNGGLTSF
ncbi:MAG: gluconate 2-dehydrogenase subunit 3 family protein [Novosphingobium sp.]